MLLLASSPAIQFYYNFACSVVVYILKLPNVSYEKHKPECEP